MEQSGKILSLQTLTTLLADERRRNKKIVHCHGIFDLLHIGHIRLFRKAKALGDILVVTILPDEHVNKGPHRPVFHQAMRAEAIAALDSVDFVVITSEATAVKTINSIRPDFYVKGAHNLTNGGLKFDRSIEAETAAVETNGGEVKFIDDDIVFSSSNLINRFLPVFPQEVVDYLTGFSAQYETADVLQYLEKAQNLKVLVIGETIIDDYHYCQAIGKSSKEPTLVVKWLNQERFAGGILAVGNHVANFCDQVGLITFLGSENSQEEFVKDALNNKIDTTFLYRTDSPTIVKRRFIENYFFTKMFEVYEINDDPLLKADNERLCALLDEKVPEYDVVIVVDFGHGMMSEEAIKIVCDKARFLAVNVQSNAGNMGYHTISTYPRADYISISESEIRLEARSKERDVKQIIEDLCEKFSCKWFTITRGKHGSLCYSQEEGFFEIPALTGHVVDRIGAGDASLAITTLCVAQKAPMEITGFIGNAVGAQAVASVGNKESIKRTNLMRYIDSLLK